MLTRLITVTAVACLALAGCSLNLNNPLKSRTTTSARVSKPMRLRPPRQAARPRVHRVSARRNAQTVYPEEPYVLDSGDRLTIAVFGQANLSREFAVDGGGYISMPLIGAVKARGLSSFDLEENIAAKLRAKYVKDPKVTVEIATYRPFFVLGEVRSPGQFPYVNGMSVQTAVAIAGGYTERARERSVQLTRRVNGLPAVRSVPTSYPVRPGDTIYVQERFF